MRKMLLILLAAIWATAACAQTHSANDLNRRTKVWQLPDVEKLAETTGARQ
jgi:hypothetical protein